MTTLTVEQDGRIAFAGDVLEHLGIKPGDQVSLDLLPGGRAEMKAVKHPPKGDWDELVGSLKVKTNGRRLTIEEIKEATEEAYVEAGMKGLK